MQEMRSGMAAILEAAQGGADMRKLAILSRQVRSTFDERLGGTDVFAVEEAPFGGLLHTTIDHNSVSIMFHVGGVLRQMKTFGDRMYYEVIGGSGRAFKYLVHPETEPVVRLDFFGVGFSYPPNAIALSKVVGGTIGRVKGPAATLFSVDALNRVTSDGIEDMRIYDCGGVLHDKAQLLFEETISADPKEWDRIFHLLNS